MSDFHKATTLVNQAKNILLTMHERMDGDDGGSILAMRIVLENIGKKTFCAIKHGVAENLRFLPGCEHIKEDIESSDFDLLITFGCSDLARTGLDKIQNLKIEKSKLNILNVDHHPDNTMFGDINLVDEKKSSVAELVFDWLNFANWTIDKNIATCLLTGIITDTGSFMHANTQSSTLFTAGELMRKGAVAQEISKYTFGGKNLQILRAWSHAIENSHYDEKKQILISIMPQSEMEHFKNLPKAAFEGFVEMLNTVPEAKLAIFLKQEGDIIKGSLRSDIFKNIDVGKIARILGGGGHKLAAGFSLAGKLEKDEQGKWKVV